MFHAPSFSIGSTFHAIPESFLDVEGLIRRATPNIPFSAGLFKTKKKREDSAGFSWQVVSIGFSSSFKKSPNLPGHRMTLSTLGCVVTHQCHTCGKGFWLLQGTQRGFWKRWWNIPGEPNKKPSPVDAHSWVYHYLGSSKLTPNWLVNGILLLGLPH